MRPFLFATLFSTLPLAAAAEMAQYQLDPDHTAISFTVDHVGYAKTLGIFGKMEGSFRYNTETQELSDVQVTIDATSVNTFHARRDGHVRNKDFLNVENFPEISFVATSGTPTSETEGTVTGDLTLLGVTQPVTLNVKLNKADIYPFGHKRFVLGLSMNTSIKRSEYNMSYAVGNGLVGDIVNVQIETEAMKME